MSVSKGVRQWAGLIAALCTAVMGGTYMVPEPYNHILGIIGTVAAVIAAYQMEPHRKSNMRTRKEDRHEVV